MADRVFAFGALALAAFYGFVALGLKAPFQYDPLGPETWPRLLAVVFALCAAYVLARPEPEPDWGGAVTLRRLGLSLAALIVYAVLFDPVGFIVTTSIYAAGMAWWGGVRPARAVVYGLGLGVLGYFVCTRLLVLNLPAGVLPF